MTAHHTIVPCTLAHLRELSRTLRAADRAELEDIGLTVRHFLFRIWRDSMDPRCALVDGEVAACFGDFAGPLARIGVVWLATASPVERLPLTFYREASGYIAERLQTRRTLIADVAEDYTASLRFWKLLGFTVGEPRYLGGKPYRRILIGEPSEAAWKMS